MATGSRKRSAKRGGGSSPLTWFISGLLVGAVGAAILFSQGVIPGREEVPAPVEAQLRSSEPELLQSAPQKEPAQRYDFFTVLPEMEVVVPERELSSRADPAAPETAAASEEKFVLQAGSFRSSADADQMKARLALIGSVANVQAVTVNNQTWHRVRIGPVSGARQADQLRRQLQENGIDVLVLKDSG
jgi:cell division protein FtsN